MTGLIRQGHFLGAKLRSLRKRNGLTLDELSARCVQIDAESAPSVSYLSMVETGKRVPSAATLEMLAGIFSKDARWFLDENTEVEAAPVQRERGGLEAMPLEPAFLFSNELLQNALPELLSQTGTTGRQFAQLLIRVWQETRHNNFPDIERAAEEGGKRQMPLTLGAVLDICKRHGLEIRWFDGDGRKPSGALVRSRFEAPGTVFINKRLAEPGRAPEVRTRVLRRPQDSAQRRRRHFAAQRRAHRRRRTLGIGRGNGRAGRAVRVARFRVQLLCRRASVPAGSVPPIPDPRGAQRVGVPQARRDPGAGHAPHDGGVALPALAFLRRVCSRLSARGLSRQRHSLAMGQHEPGLRSVPAVGGLPIAATKRAADAAPAEAEVADLGHAGRQARALVLLPLTSDARCAR